MGTLRQSWNSIAYFTRLVFSSSLHTSRQHLRNTYTVSDGKTYTVFRETVSDKEYGEKEVTLIIGFRLKLIGKNSIFHWLFQLLCMLDTPIWVGFNGFKTKFWMVKADSKDYLGLYRYQGEGNAKRYAEYICAVLKPLSTASSVWYKIEHESFELYTENHRTGMNNRSV
jgi:hypothetical protein